MKKRIFSIFTAMLILVSVFTFAEPLSVQAAGSGTKMPSYNEQAEDGKGDFSDEPIILYNINDWVQFTESADNVPASYVALGADIGSEEEPVTVSMPFYMGELFDGRGHTITVDIQGNDFTGLFNECAETVLANTTVKGSVNGDFITGALVGEAYDITVINCVSEADVSSECDAGGFCGETDNTKFINCAFYGKCSESGFCNNMGKCDFTNCISTDGDLDNFFCRDIDQATFTDCCLWDGNNSYFPGPYGMHETEESEASSVILDKFNSACDDDSLNCGISLVSWKDADGKIILNNDPVTTASVIFNGNIAIIFIAGIIIIAAAAITIIVVKCKKKKTTSADQA